jgi:hypothetical protein
LAWVPAIFFVNFYHVATNVFGGKKDFFLLGVKKKKKCQKIGKFPQTFKTTKLTQ